MQFNESAVVVSEDSAVATVCVELTDILDGLERDVLVDLTTAPGTAGTGTVYFLLELWNMPH